MCDLRITGQERNELVEWEVQTWFEIKGETNRKTQRCKREKHTAVCRSSSTLYPDWKSIPIGSRLASRNRTHGLFQWDRPSRSARITRKYRMLDILIGGEPSEKSTLLIAKEQLASNEPLISVATCDQQTIERQPSHTSVTANVSSNRCGPSL